MKVYIGPYPSRLTSNIHTKYMDKKYNFKWPEHQSKFENFLEKLESFLQELYRPINYFLDKREQKVNVKIDRWDTWSMDHTLSNIVVPMLIQLKETKHGAPFIDMDDRPEHLRCEVDRDNWDTDKYHFDAWDWVLDEMIWAFQQKMRDDWMQDYYKYEQVEKKESGDLSDMIGLKLVWEDKIGQINHQNRMSNGFRLFGKYYEALWD